MTKIRPYVRWFDMWMGLYYDRSRRTLYVGLLPMVGIRVQFDARAEAAQECPHCGCTEEEHDAAEKCISFLAGVCADAAGVMERGRGRIGCSCGGKPYVCNACEDVRWDMSAEIEYLEGIGRLQ